MRKGYWYLASAHSHQAASERERRFYDAMRATAWLLNRHIWTFSPIVHCHEMAIKYELPVTDFRFWQELDETMIEASLGVIVLKEPYWRESKGVASEIKFAQRNTFVIRELVPNGGEYDLQDYDERA